jgi:hypothetical protein
MEHLLAIQDFVIRKVIYDFFGPTANASQIAAVNNIKV